METTEAPGTWPYESLEDVCARLAAVAADDWRECPVCGDDGEAGRMLFRLNRLIDEAIAAAEAHRIIP